LAMLLAQGDWEKNFNKYDFKWVIVPKAAPLAQILSKRSQWKTVYKDEENVLLVKTEPAQ
ncbi:MAG TPA: hypothetical protein V6C72_13715, partial [Chroococcales cyanobacterium]